MRPRTVIPPLVALAGLGAAGFWHRVFRRPLPQIEGAIELNGLEGPVEIVRDRYGVPHISAHTGSDLYFGQGFCHGQDRLWQISFYRYVAAGRLSEFAGAETLSADRLMRTLGLYRTARRELRELPSETRTVLDAYAAGINAAVAECKALPAEFQILRLGHDSWSAVDSLAIFKIIGFSMSTNWELELFRAQAIRDLGPELAARLEPQYPLKNPIVMAPGEAYEGNGTDILEQMAAVKQALGLGPDASGSNNWVVSGARSATGMPLLANDPHLTSSMPTLLYQNHLRCQELDIDAHGSTLCGGPGVFFGQGKWVAWGFTNVAADVQDLFVERLRRKEGGAVEYEFKGKWLSAEAVEEEIRIKGRREPERAEVVTTHHGPIINAALGAEREPPLALSWTGLQYTSASRVITEGLSARSGKEALELFADYSVPPLNLVWADRAGNIGYHMVGKIPKRKGGCPDLPKPGWTGKYEWEGTVPFEELPSLENPESGFIVTANNRIVPDDYPHHITSEWFDGYRARRIEELLLAQQKHTPASFTRIQTDLYSIPSVEAASKLTRLKPQKQRLTKAIEQLASWDGHLDPDTVAGTIVQAFILQLARALTSSVFKDAEMADRYLSKSATGFLPVNTSPWRFQTRLLELWDEGDPSWFSGRSWDEVALDALEAALDELQERFGKNMEKWRWGRVHEIDFPHPFADANPLLARLFSRKLPGMGASDTVCQVGHVPTDAYAGIWIPAYRLIADLEDPRRSRWQHPGGQTGHPGSRQYDELMEPWFKGETQPVLLTDGEIEIAGKAKKLRLVPVG